MLGYFTIAVIGVTLARALQEINKIIERI